MTTVRIGNRDVGDGHPVLIVAEASVNHCGNMDMARRLVRAAKEAGAEAIKFQWFRADEFCSKSAKLTWREGPNLDEYTVSQHKFFKSMELSEGQLRELCALAHEVDLLFICTAQGPYEAERLPGIGADAIKIGSDELTNTELLAVAAASGLPVIISTGMGDVVEVEDAVFAAPDAIILHCTSRYPTPDADWRIARIQSIRQIDGRIGLLVGFSDHTVGHEAAVASVYAGACLIEKHFTLGNNLPGPDHLMSANPKELKRLVRAVRLAEVRRGDGSIEPGSDEARMRQLARRHAVAAREIKRGRSISAEVVRWARAGVEDGEGFEMGDRERLLSMHATCSIPEGALIRRAEVST